MKHHTLCFFALTVCFLLVSAGCTREEALEIDLRKCAVYKALLSGDYFHSKIFDLGNKGVLTIKFVWDKDEHICVGMDAFLDDEIIAKAVFKGYKEAGRAQLEEIHYARGSNGKTVIYRALSTYGIGGEKTSEQTIEGTKRYEIFDVWKTEQ